MTWAVLNISAGLDSGRRVEEGLKRLGFEFYNPRTFEKWVSKGRQVVRSVQLFPGYMFVFITKQWRVLCGTRGVIGIVKDVNGPLSVNANMIAQLRADEINGHLQLRERPPRFKNGQSVFLMSDAGAFVDKIAVYDGMCGLERSAVLLQMLGKQTRIVVPDSALMEVV
jgi:transcriptional antiterminator RfaH